MFDSAFAFLQSLSGVPAYALLFALLFSCGIGAPINEDILLVAAAYAYPLLTLLAHPRYGSPGFKPF